MGVVLRGQNIQKNTVPNLETPFLANGLTYKLSLGSVKLNDLLTFSHLKRLYGVLINGGVSGMRVFADVLGIVFSVLIALFLSMVLTGVLQ